MMCSNLESGNIKVSARLREAGDNLVWQEASTGSTDLVFELFWRAEGKTMASMNVKLDTIERDIPKNTPQLT